MNNIFPYREILEVGHEVRIDRAFRKIVDRVGQHTERDRVRRHDGDQSCGDHEDATEPCGRLPEREESVKNTAQNQAGSEPERMAE